MNRFQLILQDMTRQWRDEQVQSFVASDASGSFGIQAGHETFVTCLRPGLARFLGGDDKWHYIAQPGAVLWFADDQLYLSTAQFILSDQRDQLLEQMDEEWKAAAEALGSTKRSIAQVEQALARKLWEMNKRGEIL